MNVRRLGGIIGVAIGVAGLVFVGLQIIRDRDDFADALRSADLAWLAVAVLAGLCSMATIGLNWASIIHHLGGTAPWRRALAWFFVGQLGKYVPGGIWPIVGQAELANRSRVARSIAYPATATSMLAMLLGAATVAAAAGLASPEDRRVIAALIGIGVIALLVALAIPAVRSGLLRLASRVAGGRDLAVPEAGWLTVQTLRHVPVWLLYSAMNLAVVAALGGDVDAGLAADVAFVTCVSWIAGFVIIGLPGGLGVREAVFVSMMTAPLGAGLAASVAVTSRVVTIVVDLCGAAGAPVIARLGPAEADDPDRAGS